MTPEAEDGRWLRAHPLVFVSDLEVPALDPDDYQHLRRSLRMRPGDPCSIGDGGGRWRRARFGEVAEPTGAVLHTPGPAWSVTIAFAPVRSQKPEWVVQKLTELGVDHVIPLQSDRSVVRWDSSRAERHQERWAKIIREAAMQSRQLRLPTFAPVTDLPALLVSHPEAALTDPEGEPVRADDRLLVVGPEGGWSPEELDGAQLRSLPGGILRAETASVVAATLLVSARKPDRFTLGG